MLKHTMEGSASQAGFYYQNNVAALKIIECLFFDTDITHVILENYEKGHHIDDIIIYRKNKIEYNQIKWSEDAENVYTLYSLIASQPNKKSIFKQLAEGYNSVKNNSVDISIILFTNKRESSQKRPSEGIRHSLPEVRKNIFEPIKLSNDRYDSFATYTEYQDTLKAIKDECLLDEDSFNDFLKRLEFKFSQESIDQIKNATKARFEKLGIETSLFEKLLDCVVNWSISGEKITKDLVLRSLGISDRFEDKLSHYFKTIEDKFYVPNNTLLDKLRTALTELDGGYILIEGLPGIGKSTALTKFKEEYEEVTLAYYCFIPDAKNNFGDLRHKAQYFLKSLCVAIENQFPEVDLPNKYSEKFEEKLTSYIDKLGTLKRKIIFIIDGLDHVHRDTTLQENSLLNQIKGDLPTNVYFVLSSQYKSLLSSSVTIQVDSDPRRHILVSRFTQQEIKQYLVNKGIDFNDDIDEIERVSNGIPLYLHYISELLIETEKKDYNSILKNLPNLIDGKINSYHEYLFQKIEGDEFAKWVLAVFAYRKESSSPETIFEILKLAGENKGITDVSNVINNFAHLLKRTNGRAYTIFHNSFREFILSKTEILKDKFNSALVLFYEQNPHSDEAYRNYFKHLSDIGDFSKVITSTSLEWVKSAWESYRPIEEIEENIYLALKSCIEIRSLSEFIRISFIKAQVEKLSWNLQSSDIDFPTLLLNAGETANSLRFIWDGDFVLVRKEYFCNYLGKYHSLTGSLLPNNILLQGFSKTFKDYDYESILIEAKTEALAFGDTEEIFDYIDSIEWVNSDKHRIGYQRESYTHEENLKQNLSIKLKVIDYLFEHKKFEELHKLSKTINGDVHLLAKIKIALFKSLLNSDKNSAVKLIQDIDFSIIPDNSYFKIIAYSSSYLDNTEINQYFPSRQIHHPKIHEKTVDDIKMNYELRKDIVELFNDLKPIWIFSPEIINQLLLKVSSLPSPAMEIYNSIFHLSELWYKSRTLNLTNDAKTNLLKQSIKSLYVYRKTPLGKTNQGLFDFDSTYSFIAGSIKKLFINIFQFSLTIFSEKEIEDIINYWFTLEDSDDGYRHHTVALSIAEVLNSSNFITLKPVVYRLIQHGEKIARYEEETATLTSYIGEVANAYGICGFKEDFRRIYNQLVEISFGVSNRKDYQASYIVEPLKLMHEIDPQGTLIRLADAFYIQDCLADAGNGRMNHICLSELISFTAQFYPELAFRLLEKYEKKLVRDESIKIVFTQMLKDSTKEKLELIFTIVKTLPRWENGGTRDNHFLSLSFELLKRAIQLEDETFIDNLLDTVKQNIIVELEDSEELSNLASVFIDANKDYTKYNLPEPKRELEGSSNKRRQLHEGKFSIKYIYPNVVDLIALFEKGYPDFESYIKSQFEICSKNRRIQTFRNEYYRSKPTFEKYFNSLTSEQKSDGKAFTIIRKYVELKNQVVEYNPATFLKSSELESMLGQFIAEITDLYPYNNFKTFTEEKLEKGKWIENILQFVNEHRDYVFSHVISEDDIFSLVENVSLLHVGNLIAFINKWTSGKTNSICLLKIANRLVLLNLPKAKEILYEVSQHKDNNLLFARKEDSERLGFDIIETFFKIDKEFAKNFLLKSYFSQNGRYGTSLIGSLDILVKYHKHFDSSNTLNVYYESNLQYNRELAKGLPEINNNYDFIRNHIESLQFSESVIKHIVWVFNYPVVKVRELALQAAFDLIWDNSEYLGIFFKLGIEEGNENQIEHSLTVLNAVALKNPQILLILKKDLLSLSGKNHFNIVESIRELIYLLQEFDSDFLNQEELLSIKNLNTKSPITFDNKIINTVEGRNFIFSNYQAELIHLIYENEDDVSRIQRDLYADLISKGLGDYNSEKEHAVHRRYNINNNFDVIEIQTAYTDEVKSSINKIFHSKIKRGCIDEYFANEVVSEFRLYDPSKLAYNVNLKPDYISWLPKDFNEDDFVSFKDFDELIQNFVGREQEFITLVECGSQRSGTKPNEPTAACYFQIIPFLKSKSLKLSSLNQLNIAVLSQNLFAYELPYTHWDSATFPLHGVKPLVEISQCNYRGEQDLAYATLLPDVYSDFGINQLNLLDILDNKENNYPVKAFRWQNRYSTGLGSRRRYKPTSEGFTLKIDKEMLSDYLLKNDMDLCYEVSLRRSITQYVPEKNMEWHKRKGRVIVEIDLK